MGFIKIVIFYADNRMDINFQQNMTTLYYSFRDFNHNSFNIILGSFSE